MKRILSVILAILVCCMSFVSVLGVYAEDTVTEDTTTEDTTTEEVVETPASVNFFSPAASAGGGSGWHQNSAGHCLTGYSPIMQNDDGTEYFASDVLISKAYAFRHGWNGNPGADLTGMTWMKITMKFDKVESLDTILSWFRSYTVNDDTNSVAIANVSDISDSLSMQKTELLAEEYVDVVIPLIAETGEVKNLSMQFTDQWGSAQTLGARWYIKSIDFANDSYANTYWSHSLPENLPIGFNVFTPPNDGADYGSGADITYYGWGGKIKTSGSVAMPAPADKLIVHWADARAVHVEKDWGEYDLTGYDRVAIKLKFNSAEMAEFAFTHFNQNTDGIFATIYNGIDNPQPAVATASYEDFLAAMNANATALKAADDYVTIVVPLNTMLSGSLKNITVSAAFGIEWNSGLAVHIASIDLVNYQYYDRYIDVAPENVNVKFVDGPDFKTVANQWDPQLVLAAKENITTNKKITSVTFDLKLPEAELLRANMVYGSKGGGATFDDMQYGGADFAIYFTGTNVSRVGITQSEFYAALDENMEDLKAGKRVTLTFDLAGEFVNGGTITGIKMMVANAGKPCDISVFDGADISISHFYFNFDEEAFSDYSIADLDLDGNVSATDCTMLKKVLFDTEIEVDNFNYGDVNGNGVIDILDYMAVYNMALAAAE